MTTIIYELHADGVYYVGKTDRKPGEPVDYVVQRRLQQHWLRRWNGHTPKQNWLQSLRHPPAVRVIDEVPDILADTAERWRIQHYASVGYRLTNTVHNPYPYDVGPQRRQPWPWGEWTMTALRIIGRWMWRELRKAL